MVSVQGHLAAGDLLPTGLDKYATTGCSCAPKHVVLTWPDNPWCQGVVLELRTLHTARTRTHTSCRHRCCRTLETTRHSTSNTVGVSKVQAKSHCTCTRCLRVGVEIANPVTKLSPTAVVALSPYPTHLRRVDGKEALSICAPSAVPVIVCADVCRQQQLHSVNVLQTLLAAVVAVAGLPSERNLVAVRTGQRGCCEVAHCAEARLCAADKVVVKGVVLQAPPHSKVVVAWVQPPNAVGLWWWW